MAEPGNISELEVEVPEGRVYAKVSTPLSPRHDVPLILLHDSLGCTEMWRDFPLHLSARLGRSVISYDRLGFGRSSARQALPSACFVAEEAERHLPALLHALRVERFALFGHSVGGAMALSAAAALGERCEAVITESAQAFVENRTRQEILKAQADFKTPEMLARLQKYHGAKTNWVLSAWIDVWLSDEFSGWSLRDALPKVRCPSLVIHGDQDEYGSVAFPELISSLVSGPVEKRILPHCGHVPHRENAPLILGLVEGFLSSIA